MSDSVAAIFHDELKNWEKTLVQYSQTITALEKKLYEIIERNTVPRLAEEAEELMNHLSLLGIDVQSLFHSITEQELQLKENNATLEHQAPSQQTKSNQEMIRNKMYQTGKDLLDQEYECKQFLKDKL